jgi:hypothetical protein
VQAKLHIGLRETKPVILAITPQGSGVFRECPYLS